MHNNRQHYYQLFSTIYVKRITMKSFQLLLLTLFVTTAINACEDRPEKKQEKPSQTLTEYVNRQMLKDVCHVPVQEVLDDLGSPRFEQPQPHVSISPVAVTASIQIASSRSPSIRPISSSLSDFFPSNSPLTPQNSLTEDAQLPKFSAAFLAKKGLSAQEKNNEDKN
jgi:hypothetical protein